MRDYLQKSPFARILLPFIAGIILQPLLPDITGIFPVFILLMLIMLLLLSMRVSSYRTEFLSGILFTLFVLFSGFYLNSNCNKPENFINAVAYQATLLESPVEKPKSFAAEALLTALITEDSILQARERMLVYFSKNDTVKNLKPGNRIVFTRSPVEIQNRGNPYEFDYKAFTRRKGIFRQVYLNDKSWLRQVDDPTFRISVFAEKVRDFLLDIYIRNGLTGTGFEILSALTLGYKKSMDPEIKQLFAATGASHVLAVSGLHVGIVYLLFNLFFGYLRKNRLTRCLYLVLAILFLWGFAVVTGFAPSVQRSALMFTIVLIGNNLQRPANITNTLMASAFLLLVFNPGLVYDVGFQLSYAAVAGIVYFQPRIKSLLHFKSKIPGYLWELFTVSLAAQITTFPLSCFYFNQFPVFFWLSNFLVIPMAFAFVFLGIAILVLSPVPVVPVILVKITAFMVKLLYFSLEWIGRLPGALVTNFGFHFIHVILVFLILFTLVLFIEVRQSRLFVVITGLILISFIISTADKIIQNHAQEIIAYHTEHPVLHLISGRSNYIISSKEVLQNEFPEWETRNVIRKNRLEKPVILSEEDDFTDLLLAKRGKYMMFGGLIIKWEDRKNRSEPTIIPDVVITAGNFRYEAEYPGKCQIINYSGPNQYKMDDQMIHRINRDGAWVIRQNLLLKSGWLKKTLNFQ